ncbi:uncharacterized protein LOC110976438 [Acanthaster planci]|uniref:Uncharacterized protein LOC110976438 n=1 Tax=Acanthaster planci TaxID=133434 RepID=A0A8B7XYR9_ACAPL|nr:uncharacterized protein LOC110976438 [Acanthaster planci]
MYPARFSICLFAFASLCVFMGPSAALPLQQFLKLHRPSRSVSALQRHTSHLANEATIVKGSTDTLHENYMNDRFGQTTIVRTQDLTAPSLTLPGTYAVDANHISDSEIAERHYDNLVCYKQVLIKVNATEPTHSSSINDVIQKVKLLIARLTEVRELFNQSSADPQPCSSDTFDQNTERDQRTLYVLQEFIAYMYQVASDFGVLSSHYQ